MKKTSFVEYAADHDMLSVVARGVECSEREAVVEWLDSRTTEGAVESVA